MIRKDPNKPIKIFRCLYRRCLPLPIPNRAVKPARADGIAVTGGRVGRCLFLHGSPCWKQSRASSFKYFHTSMYKLLHILRLLVITAHGLR